MTPAGERPGLAARVSGRLRRTRQQRATRAAAAAAAREDEELLLGSVLFDEGWYSLQAGRTLDRSAAVRDYLSDGRLRGLSPHPLFDPESVRRRWSRARLKELGAGDPLVLYLRRRVFARPTHPLFDLDDYLRQAPEAADHPGGPVAHYCERGAAAGLAPNDWLPAGEDLRDWVVAAYRRALEQRPHALPRPAVGPEATVADGSVDRDPGLVSVLLVADNADDTLAAVRRLLADDTARGRELVVLDNATPALTSLSLDALRRHPEVRVIRAAARLDRWAALSTLVDHASGGTVALLSAAARPADGWLPPLLDALDATVAAVQPLLLRPDGTVRHAGWAAPEGDGADARPYPLLDGFPVEDAAGLAGLGVAALSGDALLLRHVDARQVLAGVLPDGPEADPELARRLAARGALRVVPSSRVVLHQWASGATLATTGRPGRATMPAATHEAGLWAACGFEVRGRRDDGLPELAWVGPPGSAVPPARWAIKNPAPSGSLGEIWGDTHFARSLAAALREQGAHVVIDHAPAWRRPAAALDDVALVIRGPEAYRPLPGQTTLAWVISHPETVTEEELRRYDRVLAASTVWAERCRAQWGLDVEPLLQCTDDDLFHPDTAEPDSGPAILFVGNTREVFRRIVADAVGEGLPVTIYGRGWHKFLEDGYVAGYRIDNADLSAAYRSAGVVLNDHFDDMRREGFLSNRLFDTVASGARVITDDIVGLGDLFGPSVQVYRTPADLARLARLPDPDAVFGDDAARREQAQRVRRDHSFRARARRMLEVVAELDTGRG